MTKSRIDYAIQDETGRQKERQPFRNCWEWMRIFGLIITENDYICSTYLTITVIYMLPVYS